MNGAHVTVYAPGSTSNLGPGFDCLGIAFLGKGDRVTASRAGEPGVRVRSVSDPRIPLDAARNTAALAAAAVRRRAGGTDVGLELEVNKGLPLAAGMGGSAASAVAGAVAADALLGARLESAELLQAALEAEAVVAGRHADNVAPSLLGGAVLVLGLDPPRVARVSVDPRLALVFATPAYAVETAAARAILPREVPRGDAVAQAAHLGALLLGLERGDFDLIRGSMVDLIAEPARAALYPGYGEAHAAGLAAGALGIAVSGAGPTLVALCELGGADVVAGSLERAYGAVGIEATCFVAGVDTQGARVLP